MDGSESAHIARPAPARRRIGRRVAMAAAVWIAVVAAALGVASLLDDEPAHPRTSVAPQGLPLLRLYLDRDLPASVVALPTLAAQVQKLQDLAVGEGDPARWVELGVAAQRGGDLEFADQAFQRALALDPRRLDALVGRAMVDGATGPDGLARAAAELAELARTNPKSQLVAFNAAMVAVYRSDRETAAAGFARARMLGPGTPLGILASRFGSAARTASP